MIIPLRRLSFVILTVFLLLAISGCQSANSVNLSTATFTPTNPPPTITPLPTLTATPTTSPTPTEIPCLEKTGTIVEMDVPTDWLNWPVNTRVYLPPCYDESAPSGYPVLYMFHGQAATNDQWMRLGLTNAADELITKGKIQPMLIVMPFEITWTPNPNESYFDEAFLEDVLPYVENEYAVCQERTCRAVGGLSRGGNWAVYFGFARPDLFGTVGAHSTPLFYGEEFRISQSLAMAGSLAELPFVIMDMGARDADRDKVLAFKTFLESNGISFEYNEFEGRHEESYWSAHVKDYLRWYAARFIVPQAE